MREKICHWWKLRQSKKGLSSLVATLLLTGITVACMALVYIWLKSLMGAIV